MRPRPLLAAFRDAQREHACTRSASPACARAAAQHRALLRPPSLRQGTCCTASESPASAPASAPAPGSAPARCVCAISYNAALLRLCRMRRWCVWRPASARAPCSHAATPSSLLRREPPDLNVGLPLHLPMLQGAHHGATVATGAATAGRTCPSQISSLSAVATASSASVPPAPPRPTSYSAARTSSTRAAAHRRAGAFSATAAARQRRYPSCRA